MNLEEAQKQRRLDDRSGEGEREKEKEKLNVGRKRPAENGHQSYPNESVVSIYAPDYEFGEIHGNL